MVTVQKIAADLNQRSCQRISKYPFCRTIDLMGYGRLRPDRKPLSAANTTKRLKFAHMHIGWIVDNWIQLLWFNESRFQLHHAGGRMRVFTKPQKKHGR